MRRRVLWLLAAPGFAAITNVQVLETTAAQAVISYTAPGARACTVEVSESPTYAPLVHDVNPALFPGSNSDQREGALSLGRDRIFVVGRTGMGYFGSINPFLATNKRRYSRALQVATLHYFRITCGSETAAGVFMTRTIATGKSSPEPLPADNNFPGSYNWPDPDWTDRAERIIDPNTGALLRKTSIPGDVVVDDLNNSPPATCCSGANWNSPDYARLDDANSATYNAGQRDPLYVKLGADAATSYESTYELIGLVVKLKAGISGSPTGDDRFVEICLTKDGTGCFSSVENVDLTTCSTSAYQGNCASVGSLTDMYAWRKNGEPHFDRLFERDAYGLLIRPKTTATNTISIQAVTYDVRGGLRSGWPSGGFRSQCNQNPVVEGGKTYYLCSFPAGGASGNSPAVLVSINAETGETYYLGRATINQSGVVTGQKQIAWDATNGRQFYMIIGVGGYRSVLLGEWTGPMTAGVTNTSPDYLSPYITWTNLTPAPNHLYALMQTFDSRWNAQHQANTSCSPYGLNIYQQDGKVVSFCTGSGQNNAGFTVVFDPGNKQPIGSGGTGGVVGLHFSLDSPTSRWCGVHVIVEGEPGTPWIDISGSVRIAASTNYLAGPWILTLHGPGGIGDPIEPADTVFTIQANPNSPPPGKEYQPYDPGPGPGEPAHGYWQDLEEGDLIGLSDATEYVEVVSLSGNQLTVKRANQLATSKYYEGLTIYSSYRTAKSHVAGVTGYMVCRQKTLTYPRSGYSTLWNYEADPHGNTIVYPGVRGTGNYPPPGQRYESSSGYASPQLIEHNAAGGHSVRRRKTAITSGEWPCPSVAGKVLCMVIYGTGSPAQFNTEPLGTVNVLPPFEGQIVTGVGNTYQQHPSAHGPGAALWTDVMPLASSTALFGGSTWNKVTGTSHVFKASVPALDRKYIATQATCGEKILRDISSAATGDVITDATPYTYCYAERAGECRSGAAAGDLYASCPGIDGAAAPASASCSSPKEGIGYLELYDLCVGSQWPFANGFLEAATEDDRFCRTCRLISFGYQRPHAAETLYSSIQHIPNGKWVWGGVTRAERFENILAKAPPRELDSVNRGVFTRVAVALQPPSTLAVHNAIIEFGYDPWFRCTSRDEVCVSAAGNAPYFFAGESYSGVSCAAGCTINIPVIPGRVVYYRWKYRNASNAVLHTGNTRVTAAP